MKLKLALFATLSIFASELFANAKVIGNGGDPMSVDFLNISEEVCTWAQKYQLNDFPSLISCNRVIDELKESLNSSGAAKVQFTSEPLFDNGVSKIALFNRNTRSIVVNRELWRLADKKEKYVTVGIEISGLSDEKNRYNFGQAVDLNFETIFAASKIACNISVVDRKSGRTRQILPNTKRSLNLKFDFSFQANYELLEGQTIRVELLGSVPDKVEPDLGISWSIRDISGAAITSEDTIVNLPYIRGSKVKTKIVSDESIFVANCELQ